MSKSKKVYKERLCIRECCNNIFIPHRIDMWYCSKICSSAVFREILKQERIEYRKTKNNKPKIQKEYLVRGRISGMGY